MTVKQLRIGVTGGRSYGNTVAVRAELLRLPVGAILVHGAAPGADSLCAAIWREMREKDEPHPADWTGPCRDTCTPGHRRVTVDRSMCPAAGVYRNQEMVDSGLDKLIAFPGGRGTLDMVRRAEKAGIEIKYIGE